MSAVETEDLGDPNEGPTLVAQNKGLLVAS
jgi:hypothetical protein